jgi:hypothetical protein
MIYNGNIEIVKGETHMAIIIISFLVVAGLVLMFNHGAHADWKDQ